MSLIPSSLQRGFEASLSPLVARLIARGVDPNAITTVGTLFLVGAGVAFGAAQIRLGGVLLLVSGVCDTLDGRVARGGRGTTAFGAFYDSTLDRVGESALFVGIGVFFMSGGVPDRWRPLGVGLAMTALAAGLIVSYARARAEGLGLECKVGIGQRAERLLGLGVPALFFGAGPQGRVLLGIVSLLALVSLVTVGQRIVHVYRRTRSGPVAASPRPTRTTQGRQLNAGVAEYIGKGRGGE
ncbi:MAG TPA: CDP-alcohol phosphatidyltransferase family protein [Gemmatimonadales bacterium]